MSFVTGTQAELLYTLTSAITKNTFTTQAAITGVLGTNTVCNIPAGWINSGSNPNPVGRSLYLRVFGTTATTAAATIAVALGLDPTAGTINQSITVAGAAAPQSGVTCPFTLEAWYTCTTYVTNSATFQVNGRWIVESVASGGVPTTTSQTVGFSGTHAVDPRVINYVEVFGTWSASAAGNTTTVQQMLLWGLN